MGGVSARPLASARLFPSIPSRRGEGSGNARADFFFNTTNEMRGTRRKENMGGWVALAQLQTCCRAQYGCFLSTDATTRFDVANADCVTASPTQGTLRALQIPGGASASSTPANCGVSQALGDKFGGLDESTHSTQVCLGKLYFWRIIIHCNFRGMFSFISDLSFHMHYSIINSRFGSKLLAARLPRFPPACGGQQKLRH